MSAAEDEGTNGRGGARAHPAPDLGESLRQIRDSGRAGLGAAGDAAKAMRSLVAADVSLARSAFGRTLALTGAAIVFGASAWLLMMAVLVVFLSREVGLSWSLSLLIPALLSATVAGLSAWRAICYFEHTRLQATRRQLARLGLGELSRFMPDADSSISSREASERPNRVGPQARDERGVDITPP
ncbi:MAG: phage holin family protein [Pseudomonadota bacterium]|nr:phage holin family protein [Pseudomonadota bacterium]